MNKIAVVIAATGLLALAACGKTPANESANAANIVAENSIDNVVNAEEPMNAAEAPANMSNTANAL